MNFGRWNLQPRPGRQWAAISGKGEETRPRAAAPDARDLHPHRRGPAPVRRL